MRLSLVPILVFLMPLAEIAGFIIVGKMVGVWATLALVILSALLGATLLRIQGIGILQRISAESRNGGDPGREMVHGAMIVVAAFLLMLPASFLILSVCCSSFRRCVNSPGRSCGNASSFWAARAPSGVELDKARTKVPAPKPRPRGAGRCRSR